MSRLKPLPLALVLLPGAGNAIAQNAAALRAGSQPLKLAATVK